MDFSELKRQTTRQVIDTLGDSCMIDYVDQHKNVFNDVKVHATFRKIYEAGEEGLVERNEAAVQIMKEDIGSIVPLVKAYLIWTSPPEYAGERWNYFGGFEEEGEHYWRMAFRSERKRTCSAGAMSR